MAVALRRDGDRVSLNVEPPAMEADGEAYLAALAAVSAQAEPYVLLVDVSAGIELTQEQRKAQNLWYKAGRAQVESACRAFAMVRADADAESQRVWQSLFSLPVLVTRDRAEAEAFLGRFSTERAGA